MKVSKWGLRATLVGMTASFNRQQALLTLT
jgi:hypothetical protein